MKNLVILSLVFMTCSLFAGADSGYAEGGFGKAAAKMTYTLLKKACYEKCSWDTGSGYAVNRQCYNACMQGRSGGAKKSASKKQTCLRKGATFEPKGEYYWADKGKYHATARCCRGLNAKYYNSRIIEDPKGRKTGIRKPHKKRYSWVRRKGRRPKFESDPRGDFVQIGPFWRCE